MAAAAPASARRSPRNWPLREASSRVGARSSIGVEGVRARHGAETRARRRQRHRLDGITSIRRGELRSQSRALHIWKLMRIICEASYSVTAIDSPHFGELCCGQENIGDIVAHGVECKMSGANMRLFIFALRPIASALWPISARNRYFSLGVNNMGAGSKYVDDEGGRTHRRTFAEGGLNDIILITCASTYLSVAWRRASLKRGARASKNLHHAYVA